MTPILQLIIAHLLADFVFQTNKLIKEKEKHLSGHLKHVGILGLCAAALIFPYLNSPLAWLTLAVLTGTHLLQDYSKVAFEKKFNKKKKTWPFFLDQALHLSVIFIMGHFLSKESAMALSPNLETLYFSSDLALFITLVILFSFALDIILFEIKRSKKRSLKYRRHYKQMSVRLLAFLIFYMIVLGFLFGS